MCQGSLQVAEEAPDDTVVIAVTCPHNGACSWTEFFGSTVPLDPVAPGELEIGHSLVQRTLVRVEIRKNKGNRLFSKRWTALDSHREPSAILT